MHHYGLRINISDTSFSLNFQNSHTGSNITVSGPLQGVYDDPHRDLDERSVQSMGTAIQEVLNHQLTSKPVRLLQEQTDYELRVDTQVEKFFESKQKLIYFIITGSLAVVAFMANFLFQNISKAGDLLWFVVLSSVLGLGASGYAILSLYGGLESYKLHLKHRYERKDYAELSAQEQKDFQTINQKASKELTTAFVLLFLEIGLAISFFVFFFILYNSQ